MARTLGIFVSAVIILIGGYYLAFSQNWLGTPPGPGTIEGEALPDDVVLSRQSVQMRDAQSVGVDAPKQILFGDFHVHTTYSTDAFLWALPMNGGSGVHPIGEACDYARYCSSIDFWSITDHAEASTPRKWQETKDSIRQCQAVSGQENPDLISFVGFEWTQVGRLPESHYGHKNVIFKGLDDDDISARPISSAGIAGQALRTNMDGFPPLLPISEFPDQQAYFNFNAFVDEVRRVGACDPGVSSDQLPAGCYEEAETPGELVRRLEQQGLDPLIIPHGSSWGYYTPPGTSWDKQLKADMRPEKFPIIEIMSGHGNSEEYRSFRAANWDSETQTFTCPEPSENYLPSCWRASQIIEERCLAEGIDGAECKQRAVQTRNDYAMMSVAGHLTVHGEDAVDWLNAGQCQDCFQPSFNHRPLTSVQYGLAISNFDNGPEAPIRFNWGFIASSDNHRARPGTGYKEVARHLSTESGGAVNETWAKRFHQAGEPDAQSHFIPQDELATMTGFQLTEVERQSSFWLTGGLAAVHAENRSRDAIWDAFQRKEVYGTSGPRILLWFDLLNGADGIVPMGGQVAQDDTPTFRVRAIGAFKQNPGCPEFSEAGLDAERLERLCSGECYNPSDERHLIKRIEIVRIRPQVRPDEPVDDLIDDPFLVHECPPNEEGCQFTFRDEDYTAGGRDATYYARAVQEATPTINANNLRCEYDEDGNCKKVNPCFGDYRVDREDQCLAPSEHRAWSSPIYLAHSGVVATSAEESGLNADGDEANPAGENE